MAIEPDRRSEIGVVSALDVCAEGVADVPGLARVGAYQLQRVFEYGRVWLAGADVRGGHHCVEVLVQPGAAYAGTLLLADAVCDDCEAEAAVQRGKDGLCLVIDH